MVLSLGGCESGMPTPDDDALPDDPALVHDADAPGSVQQALITCTRPTGWCGTQYNTLGYITGVHVNTTNAYQLDIVYSYNDPGTYGPPFSGVVDFGVAQANFTGSGWSGAKITSMGVKTPNSSGCMFGTDLYCWVINGSVVLKMNQQASNLIPSNGVNTSQSFGNGITKMRGYGDVDPQKFRFYFDAAGSISFHTWTALGPGMTTCADPD